MILSIGNLGWTQLSSWNWLLSARKKVYWELKCWELKRYCQIQPLCRTAQAYPRKQRGTFFWASKWEKERKNRTLGLMFLINQQATSSLFTWQQESFYSESRSMCGRGLEQAQCFFCCMWPTKASYKVSPNSRARKVGSTSWWEEPWSHIQGLGHRDKSSLYPFLQSPTIGSHNLWRLIAWVWKLVLSLNGCVALDLTWPFWASVSSSIKWG